MAKYTITTWNGNFEDRITIDAHDYRFEADAPMVTFYTSDNKGGFSLPTGKIVTIERDGVRNTTAGNA